MLCPRLDPGTEKKKILVGNVVYSNKDWSLVNINAPMLVSQF